MKKFFVIFLTLVMAFALVACGQAADDSAQDDAGQAAEDVVAYPYTIVDQNGREVTINAEPQKVSTIYGVAVTYVTALGKADLLVCTNEGIESPCLYDYIAPQVVDLPSAGKKMPELEILADLGAELHINRGRDTEAIDAVQNAGIATIAIAPETAEQVCETYDLLGKVLGAEERAEELKAAYMAVIDKAAAIAAEIPEADRKTAIMMGSSIGKVANGHMMQSVMIETAGGINPATEVETTELWPVVGVEQIFAWDPDFIFLSSYGSADYTPEDLLNDPTWAATTAAQNGHLLKTPGALESWELPGPSSALGALWMLNQMYPEVYTDAELQADVEAYYEILYPGNTFTRDLLGY